MTKYFKLLGVALLATTLCFTSCTKGDDPTTDPGTENPDPGTGDPDPGTGDNPDPGTGDNPDPGTTIPTVPSAGAGEFLATFGTSTWSAQDLNAVYLSQYNAVSLSAISQINEQGQIVFPMIEILSYAPASITGTINSGEIDPNSFTYSGGELVSFYYYDDMLLYIDNDNSGSVTDGDDVFGDWWAKSLSMNITAFDATAMTMSATVNAVMFDAYAALVDQLGIEAADTETMVFVANALQMENGEGKGVSFLRK
jgi:hypothetical protein